VIAKGGRLLYFRLGFILEEKYGDRPGFVEPDEKGCIMYEHKYAKLENGNLPGITWNPRERMIIVRKVKKVRTNMKGLCDFTERYSKMTTPPIYMSFDPHGGGVEEGARRRGCVLPVNWFYGGRVHAESFSVVL